MVTKHSKCASVIQELGFKFYLKLIGLSVNSPVQLAPAALGRSHLEPWASVTFDPEKGGMEKESRSTAGSGQHGESPARKASSLCSSKLPTPARRSE